MNAVSRPPVSGAFFLTFFNHYLMKLSKNMTFIGDLADDGRTLTLVGSQVPVWLDDLKGCSVEVVVNPIRPKKTGNQHRYWFGVVVPHVQAFIKELEGKTLARDQVHAFLMTSFGPSSLVEHTVLGRKFMVMERASFADGPDALTVEEASQLIEEVIGHFQHLGLNIPPAGPTGTISDY